MRLWMALVALVVSWANVTLAQSPLDPRTMQPAEIEGLQRRLTDARCYTGLIDGRPSEALTKAIAACPDQRPILRIETGMHAAAVQEMGVDRACRLAVTASYDKTVRIWSLPGARLLRTLRVPIDAGNGGKIYAVAISPDGKWVAAGGWDASWDAFKSNSIYLFDAATGQSLRRLGNYGNVINYLEFSRDGTRVAAALGGGLGVRILDVAGGGEVGADRDFGGKGSFGLTTFPDGSVASVAFDGMLRHSAADGRRLAQTVTRGGKQPFSVSVNPAGSVIAVGFVDTPAVDFYDAADLSFRGTADVSGIKTGGNLGRVAWSGDGRRLYAGGLYTVGSAVQVRVFSPDGKRLGPDLSASENTLVSLAPCGDAMMFAAQDPSFGLIAPNGAVTTLARSHGPDMRGKNRNAFTVSADGLRVRFGLGVGDINSVLTDLATRTLSESRTAPAGVSGPDITGLPITNWENGVAPQLAGKPLALGDREISRALAIRPDRAGFVLGTEFAVRAFDARGQLLWSKPVPSIAWGVNLTRGGEMVVAAYDDGTVRWLRWRDGQELLALFVNKDTRAWVAWTPTGYYAASPGAEDMIGWHVNRGWDQAADFFPASKFRDIYARADIVDRVLDTLDEAEAIRQANAARPDKSAAKPITDLLPPVVSILSPTEGASVAGDEVRVDYIVRSPAGLPVDAVEALIDGRPASRERGLGRPGDATALRDCLAGTRGLGRVESGGLQGCRGSLTVRLSPDAREIGLFARTGERAGDVAKIRIVRTAAATAGAEGTKPKLYALVVGISAYANPTYSLQYAAKDARDFSAALENQRGGVYGDVIVRNAIDGEATKNGILDGLDWLTKQVTNRDVGLVFLAGHGVLDDRDRFYFVAADSDIDRLRTTGVPREDIQDALDALPGKALLFLDACHAGAVGLSKVRSQGIDINGVANEFTRTERGVVMFTASTGKQVSQENAAWGNGAFTKAVIEGLGTLGQRGKADLLGKGTISASALDVYVSERVKDLTDGRQSPVMIRPSTVPDFTLAAVR